MKHRTVKKMYEKDNNNCLIHKYLLIIFFFYFQFIQVDYLMGKKLNIVEFLSTRKKKHSNNDKLTNDDVAFVDAVLFFSISEVRNFKCHFAEIL